MGILVRVGTNKNSLKFRVGTYSNTVLLSQNLGSARADPADPPATPLQIISDVSYLMYFRNFILTNVYMLLDREHWLWSANLRTKKFFNC